MKRERWRTVFFLVIVLVVTLFVRLSFLQTNSLLITGEESIQKAFVGEQGIYKLQRFTLDEIYTTALSFFMLLFGNYEPAGVYLNIVIQTIAIVLTYTAIAFVANEYVAGLIALVISVIPFYSDKCYEISSFHLLILLYAVGLLILAIISKGVYMFAIKKKPVEQVDAYAQEEQTGVITLDDIIGNGNSSKESSQKDSQQQDKMQAEETGKAEESDKVPLGMKEIILDEEDKKKKVKFLENPLPVPKRREHKEMDFAVELRDNNDDYDIKDVSGMDFFDIE